MMPTDKELTRALRDEWRREMATAALQGILAATDEYGHPLAAPYDAARLAVEYADVLLFELERDRPPVAAKSILEEPAAAAAPSPAPLPASSGVFLCEAFDCPESADTFDAASKGRFCAKYHAELAPSIRAEMHRKNSRRNAPMKESR